MSDNQYPPREVCYAACLPQGTMNSWFFHGKLAALEMESLESSLQTSQGKTRLFSEDIVMALALITRLSTFNIPPHVSAKVAIEAARDALQYEKTAQRRIGV